MASNNNVTAGSVSSDGSSLSSSNNNNSGNQTTKSPKIKKGVGRFDKLTWRMPPSESYSDWIIEIVHHHQPTSALASLETAPASATSTTNSTSTITSSSTTSNAPHVDVYHVHRSALAVGPRHSEYFAAQFQLSTQENQTHTSRITLEPDCANVYSILLDFLYSTENPFPCTLTPPTATALYSLAEYFDVPRLRQMVQSFYKKHVDTENVVEFITCALRHQAMPLMQIAIETCVDDLLQLSPSTAKHLQPSLLCQILQANAGVTATATEDREDSTTTTAPTATTTPLPNRTLAWHTSKLVAACAMEQHRRAHTTAHAEEEQGTTRYNTNNATATATTGSIADTGSEHQPATTAPAMSIMPSTEESEPWNREIFDKLTNVQLLPYIEPTSAVYLLSLDAALHQESAGATESENNKQQHHPHSTSGGHPFQSTTTCLQHRCIQAITSQWKSLRKASNSISVSQEFKQALASISSDILLEILYQTTDEANAKLLDMIGNETIQIVSPDGQLVRESSRYRSRNRTNETEQGGVSSTAVVTYKHEIESTFEPPPRILVQNAGRPELNGLYLRGGTRENAPMYTSMILPSSTRLLERLPKTATLQWIIKNTGTLCIFKCEVGGVYEDEDNDNSISNKYWFLSIVPSNFPPGTIKDIDLYSASVTEECMIIPPKTGWRRVMAAGLDPPPTLFF